MSETKNITYEEVAGAANSLVSKGEHITPERIRLELGKGNYTQLISLLEKWTRLQRRNQSQSENKRFRHDLFRRSNSHRVDPVRNASRRRSHLKERTRDFVQPKVQPQRTRSYEPSEKKFSIERLQQEHTLVAKLFYALIIVRDQRTRTLESYQVAYDKAFDIRMSGEEQIRELKEKNENKLSELLLKFSRLKIVNETQITAIRKNWVTITYKSTRQSRCKTRQ